MTNYRYIHIKREDAIGILTLDHSEALNALSSAVLGELGDAVSLLAQDAGLKVLIITGAGRAFVAGADISEMSNMGAVEGKDFGRLGCAVLRAIEQLPFPTIAAVNGFALGGGCELAMACDIRLASTVAKFGQPEVGLGITPGFGGTQRMARLIGSAKAKELIFTGRVIGADEAARIGLVNQVIEAEELISVAKSMARKIAANSASALRLAKEAIDRGLQTDMDTGMAIEQSLFGLCFATADQREGMNAFLEKRKPNFR